MKIELEVPDNKVSFIMELIESIPFIKFKKVESSSANQMDTTDYLLSTSTNKSRLLAAIDRSKNGDVEYYNLIEE
ncbi:hypothetical protein [Dyadobacter sp. CY312]|uniref:hypothetical protein n=1 Tax=Dyadobacter sp. CY312 TaxID=2907303 RepID=UPI001F32732B|nr:hypothetical protein [Dyadobacter sp. CY312]MCE7042582.1 hypothetical protein [Dyadobacter sp. CY312]